MKRVVSVKVDEEFLHMFDKACKDIGFSNRSECIRSLMSSFAFVVAAARRQGMLEELRRGTDPHVAVGILTPLLAKIASETVTGW